MRAILCGTTVLTVWLLVAVRAGDPPQTAVPGMSLRLELFVDDVQKSAEFYTSVLGFERLPGGDDYLPVRCGTVVIGLGPAAGLPPKHHFNPEVQQGRRGLGAEIVLEVDDVQEYFQRVKATGYGKISSPPLKRPWGATDFRLIDPDGYYLRITSR